MSNVHVTTRRSAEKNKKMMSVNACMCGGEGGGRGVGKLGRGWEADTRRKRGGGVGGMLVVKGVVISWW